MYRNNIPERKPGNNSFGRIISKRSINRINVLERISRKHSDVTIYNDTSRSKQDTFRNYKNKDESFHRAIGPILTVGQFFGVMPVYGILSDDAANLKFTCMSWRVLHTIVAIIFTGCMAITCLIHIIVTGAELTKVVSLTFFGSTCLSLILFLKLARRWPSLSVAIAQTEYRLKYSSYVDLHVKQKRRWTLRSRFCACCFVVLSLSLVEHILSNIAGVVIAGRCAKERSLLETFFLYSYPQVFYFSQFNVWFCPFLQFAIAESTFNWNFMDLFIIIISHGLTEKFERLNERLAAATGKNLPEEFWRVSREDFVLLSRLVRQVDESINEVVFLSFANNLYFICVQFFNSIKPLRSFTHVIYFTFSLGFLIARFLSVSLFAAKLNSASKKPAAATYAVPSASFCIEVLRFQEQVTKDVVALTGLNFFVVTRGLILTIVGTVITYELVLMQFNPSATVNTTDIDPCTLFFYHINE